MLHSRLAPPCGEDAPEQAAAAGCCWRRRAGCIARRQLAEALKHIATSVDAKAQSRSRLLDRPHRQERIAAHIKEVVG